MNDRILNDEEYSQVIAEVYAMCDRIYSKGMEPEDVRNTVVGFVNFWEARANEIAQLKTQEKVIDEWITKNVRQLNHLYAGLYHSFDTDDNFVSSLDILTSNFMRQLRSMLKHEYIEKQKEYKPEAEVWCADKQQPSLFDGQ